MRVVHDREATRAEHAVDRIISIVGQPFFLALTALFIMAWMVVGLLRATKWPDHYPFPFLNLAISAVAICIAILILASQRRADRLAQRRQQLALEVALLAEHKTSKIIDLMEELRRDLPNVHKRIDLEAIEMSSKSDHGTVLDIIEKRTVSQAADGKSDGAGS